MRAYNCWAKHVNLWGNRVHVPWCGQEGASVPERQKPVARFLCLRMPRALARDVRADRTPAASAGLLRAQGRVSRCSCYVQSLCSPPFALSQLQVIVLKLETQQNQVSKNCHRGSSLYFYIYLATFLSYYLCYQMPSSQGPFPGSWPGFPSNTNRQNHVHFSVIRISVLNQCTTL